MRVGLALGIGVFVVVLSIALQRRRYAPPTQASWHPPVQVDRADFSDPEKPWLVAVFSSLSCDASEKAITAASFLASNDVAYQNIAVEEDPALHQRYHIEQIPLLLIVDHEGVARANFVGPPVATEVWAEFAHIREHASTA